MKWSWLLLLAVACSDPSGGSVEGPKIYQSMCATCHGPTGKPDATMVARLGVRDLTDPALRPMFTPAHVEQQVRTGSKNKLMPSFVEALTAAQITAVSVFVASPAFVTPPK